MAATRVKTELEENALWVTLDSPDTLNILDMPARESILEALSAHLEDDAVKCVIFSAAGEVFSAGADLHYILGLGLDEAKSYTRFVRKVLDTIEAYPKPTIALVDGLAIGGGLELLLAVDIVVASTNARFGQTELNVGLIPGGGGTQRLPRAIGLRKAKEMIFTGGYISAQDALNLGLVNKVVERDRLREEGAKLSKAIASKSTASLRLAKEALNGSTSGGLEDGLSKENSIYPRIIASQEAKNRIRDFLEKRASTAKR